MAAIDTSKAPIGLMAAEQLVQAISMQGDLVERHYLEIKSHLNFASKRDKEKLAKFILGASNRMPDLAANAFEGYAVMVIGVSNGIIDGVEPVEMLEISKIVEKFLGPSGPKWDLLWLPVANSTNKALLIYVDPPKLGQPPFPCRANGDSLTDGRIYIRAEGETREATSGEIDLLMERAAAGENPPVELSVEVTGDLASIVIDESATLNRFIEQTRSRLLFSLPRQNPQLTDSIRAFMASHSHEAYLGSLTAAYTSTYEPEERTEEEFVESINEWEDQFRGAWPEATLRLASAHFSPTRISVINRTKTFLRGVQANLHLAGNVFAEDFRHPNEINHYTRVGLPAPPRKWGPTQRFHDYLLSPHLYGNPVQNQVSLYTPSITFKNGKSVDIHLDVGELRPLSSYQSETEEFILIVNDRSLETIKVTWEITAHDHNDVFVGEFEIPIGGTIDLTETMADLLQLETSPISRGDNETQ